MLGVLLVKKLCFPIKNVTKRLSNYDIKNPESQTKECYHGRVLYIERTADTLTAISLYTCPEKTVDI